MFYIIETKEQLERFGTYDLENCFLEIIRFNDSYHPALAPISLVYLKPFKSRNGFIISINHSEALNLNEQLVFSFLSEKVGSFYVLDGKKTRYSLLPADKILCINTALYLDGSELVYHQQFNTKSHDHFIRKYNDKNDLNRIIPISKHYEKYEILFKTLKVNMEIFSKKYYKFYNNYCNDVLFTIEKNGINIDIDLFDKYFSPANKAFSVSNDKVFTQYNLFTGTGRPSNAFNGINFAALKKDNGSRKCFVPGNDVLVEFDYSSYHLKILCELLNYHFDEPDIHAHLAKKYFNKDVISNEEYNESKQITFRLLFTDSDMNHPFFVRVKEYRERLWIKYKTNGYLPSTITNRPLRGIDNKNKILPYLLQCYETERNILILKDLLEYLQGRDVKLILYTYDSFLFDICKQDVSNMLMNIQYILEQSEFRTSCSYGTDYQNLNLL